MPTKYIVSDGNSNYIQGNLQSPLTGSFELIWNGIVNGTRDGGQFTQLLVIGDENEFLSIGLNNGGTYKELKIVSKGNTPGAGTLTIELGQVHEIRLTYDQPTNTATIFLDGVEDYSVQPINGTTWIPQRTTYRLFNVILDAFSAKAKFSQARIIDLANPANNITLSPAASVDGSTTVVDTGTNGNDGTLFNFTGDFWQDVPDVLPYIAYDFEDNAQPSDLTILAGTLNFSNGLMTPTGTIPPTVGWFGVFDSTADGVHSIYIKAGVTGTAISQGLAFRVQDENNYMFARIRTDGTAASLRINPVVNGAVVSAIGTNYTIPDYDPTQFNKITVDAQGTAITVLLNDIAVITDINPSDPNTSLYINETRVGFRLGDNLNEVERIEVASNAGNQLQVSLTGEQKVIIGNTATVVATATGGEGTYSYTFRVDSGTATLSAPTLDSRSFTVTDTVRIGCIVSDGVTTLPEVFTYVRARETNAVTPIPNFTGTATQGLEVDDTGVYLSNSDFGAIDGIVKRGFDDVVIWTNNNLYSTLPAGQWKSNDICVDKVNRIIYLVPTDESANNARALVRVNADTGDVISFTTLNHVGFSASICIGHTGNLFLCTFATADGQTPINRRRFLEITTAGVEVQYWEWDVEVLNGQGITYDGSVYKLSANNNTTGGTIHTIRPLTAPNMLYVKETFLSGVTLPFDELEGKATHVINGVRYYYSHDINGIPFTYLDVDIALPVITLLGQTPVDVIQGDAYNDAGATALDNVDGDITNSIVTVNPVDTSTLGTYTVTYNVTDLAGNVAAQVTRTVNVLPQADTTAPTITLLGNNPETVTQGQAYTDAGATAFDNVDGDISNNIVTVNPVNTSIIGVYQVTYNVTDAAGNQAIQATRTVNVVANLPTINVSQSTSTPERNQLVTFAANAVNTDSIAWSAIGITLNENTGVSITGQSLQLGDYTVTAVATNAGGTAQDSISGTVIEVQPIQVPSNRKIRVN